MAKTLRYPSSPRFCQDVKYLHIKEVLAKRFYVSAIYTIGKSEFSHGQIFLCAQEHFFPVPLWVHGQCSRGE